MKCLLRTRAVLHVGTFMCTKRKIFSTISGFWTEVKKSCLSQRKDLSHFLFLNSQRLWAVSTTSLATWF